MACRFTRCVIFDTAFDLDGRARLLRRGREGEGRGGEERDGELHFYVPARDGRVRTTENDGAPSAGAEPILGATFEPRKASGRLGDASAAWRPRGAAWGGV